MYTTSATISKSLQLIVPKSNAFSTIDVMIAIGKVRRQRTPSTMT
jgi:hypothetical protein